MAEKIKLNFEIDGLKDANKELAQLEKSAEDLKKQLDGVEEGSEAFKKINGELQKTTKHMALLKDATGQLDLDSKFEDVYGEAVPLNTQLGELEDRMYALAAAGLQNTEGFKALQDEVVGMRQTIIRVDESIDDLAANRGISTFGTQLRGVGESLLTMDFERASKQAQGLANSVGNINFGQAINGIKNLGSTFINLGKALLANPIFLIAAVIIGIVMAVKELLEETGLLKVIMEAVGAVFQWVGDIINDYLIQPLKDLTDWLGWTNNAAEEMAESQADAAKKAADAQEASSKKIIQSLDNEMREIQAKGELNEEDFERTLQIEKEKREALFETAKARAEEAVAAFKAAMLKGELDEQELLDMRAKAEEMILSANQAREEIRLGELEDDQKRTARRETQKAEDEADAKERADRYKQFLADRLVAERQQEDLRIELLDEGTEKEIEVNRVKYQRLIEDTKTNEKLKEDEKLAIIDYYTKLQVSRKEQIEKAAQEKADKEKKESDERDIKAMRDKFFSEQDIQKELIDLRIEQNEGNYEKLRQLEQERFNEELETLNFQLEQKILSEEEYNLKKQQLEKQSADNTKAINDKQIEDEQRVRDAKIEMASQAIGGVADLLTSFGEANEKQAKRNFQINKAAQIAQAVISTYQGANAIFASAAANPATILFPAQPFIAAGLAIASGLGNVAKIASQKFEGGSTGGGSGGGSGAGSQLSSAVSAPTPPSINLFGNANEGSEGFGEQQSGLRQQTMVKAIVVESDITNTQNRLSTYQQRSEIG